MQTPVGFEAAFPRPRKRPARALVRTTAIVLLVLVSFVAAPVAALDEARTLFESHQNSVLQVRVLDIDSGSKSSIGSGFWATAEGHVITNFHVIADIVHEPDHYRAEYVLDNGERGDLQLLDIDVVHDLAVLVTAHPAASFIPIETDLPAKGEPLFSLGNPRDLGFSIVGGIYNGLIENSLYEKIHFTGALNPGMSGGPTINRSGRVVGVNVATGGNQLGFLVPGKRVTRLLERAIETPRDIQSFAAAVTQQLLENQAGYMARLTAELGRKPVAVSGFDVPGELMPYFKCWGSTEADDKYLFTITRVTCHTDDGIFLTDAHQVGAVDYRHHFYSMDDMGLLRFHHFLEERLVTPLLSIDTDEDIVGNYQCHTRLVRTDALRFKTVFCVRPYKTLTGLYDVFVTALTRVEKGAALQTSFTLSGVSYDNILGFLDRYLQAITWTKQP